MTLERPADGSNFNRRYATGTIRALLPGVETAGLKSAAAPRRKPESFFKSVLTSGYPSEYFVKRLKKFGYEVALRPKKAEKARVERKPKKIKKSLVEPKPKKAQGTTT